MYKYLPELCENYDQDFESIFETELGPIDIFCEMFSLEEQKKLVIEMEMFLKETEVGTKTKRDLNKMGLEYNPSDDGSWNWFRDAMEYLKKKIAEG